MSTVRDMTTSSTMPPQVAVLFPGDCEDPSVRSGTPYGVVRGLRELGADVRVIDVRAAPTLEQFVALAMAPLHQRGLAGAPWHHRVRRGYSSALVAGALARWRSAAATRRLEGPWGDGLDAVVQLGAGYEVITPLPLVVYDDMTVAQAVRAHYPEWPNMRRADVRARLTMQERVYARASACAMTSSWAARSAMDDYGIHPERVHVVGAGSHDVPRHVDRAWTNPSFLLVGKDFARKNGPRVLEAFARVREVHPGARLDVVGEHPQFHEPGVVGHGSLSRADDADDPDRLERLYDAATCFVMPSLHEPAGVVFTEAAAAGLPSIGGTVGGSADVIADGGVVVDPYDVAAITAAMLGFCDPAVAALAGARASSRSADLTWSAVAGRLLRCVGLDEAPAGGDLAEDLPLRPAGAGRSVPAVLARPQATQPAPGVDQLASPPEVVGHSERR